MKKKLPTPQKQPSGMYRCQVMIGKKRISVVEEDPKIAQAKAVAIRAGIIEERKSPSSMTVGEAIDRYIESKDAVLSPSTIRGYQSIRENSLGSLESVRLDDLAQKVKTETKIPTIEEVQLLAEKAKGTKFELPFLLATWMGLRTSEIRGLTWDCIEGDVLHVKQALVLGESGPVLKNTKSYSGNRKIRMPSYIKELLEHQERAGEYVISCPRNSLYKQLRKLCDQNGLPHYRFHDLRHVQASVMLALGVPDKYAMERMGHASTNMLKTVYQHTMKSKSEEVADKVDHFFSEKLHTEMHTKE